MEIDWGLTLRGIIFIISCAGLIAGIAGTFYVYRYKISANCKALKNLNDSVHEIREEKIPCLVPYEKMEDMCHKQTASCRDEKLQSEDRIVQIVGKLEKTIITRLDKMDEERNTSRVKQTDQREKRLIEFTQVKTNVDSLCKRFTTIEEKLA